MLVKVPKTTCNYCSKHTDDLLVFSGNVRFCAKCWENHIRVTKMLSGEGACIDRCQICNVPIFELMEAQGKTTMKMSIIQKDGIYQYACKPCAVKYNRKRLDLFKETAAERLYVG